MRMPFSRRNPAATLKMGDVPFISPVHAAQVLEPAPAAMWAVYLMLVAICTAPARAARRRCSSA